MAGSKCHYKKGVVMRLLLIFIFLAGFCGLAQAEDYYNASGAYEGSSYEYGNRTDYQDVDSGYSGSDYEYGNRTDSYDDRGVYQGSSYDYDSDSDSDW